VQVIPHVTDAIKEFVPPATRSFDFVLVEIGGTVGDIEGLPFFEAIRQLGNDLPRGRLRLRPPDAAALHSDAGELKTKPTQHSVQGAALHRHPARHPAVPRRPPIPEGERRKLALFCNVRESAVIEALDVASIYDVPLAYHNGLDTEVLPPSASIPRPARSDALGGRSSSASTTRRRGDHRHRRQVHRAEGRLQIADRGAGAWRHRQSRQGQPRLDRFECSSARTRALSGACARHPGARRLRRARLGGQDRRRPRFARERKVPYFGICFGMQMAVIEARATWPASNANSTEFGPAKEPVVGLMTEWLKGNELEKRSPSRRSRRHDAPRRLSRQLKPGSQSRRHLWLDRFPSATATATRSTWTIASGWRPARAGLLRRVAGRLLPEIVEYADHPVVHRRAVSPRAEVRPFEPHPLFAQLHRRGGGAEPAGVIVDAFGEQPLKMRMALATELHCQFIRVVESRDRVFDVAKLFRRVAVQIFRPRHQNENGCHNPENAGLQRIKIFPHRENRNADTDRGGGHFVLCKLPQGRLCDVLRLLHVMDPSWTVKGLRALC
jgi:CTP synthase